MQARQEIQQDLERYRQDALYFEAHRQELVDQYPERWVAIYRQQVVGAAKDLGRLIRQLERKGIPRGRAFVEFATDREELLIL